MYKKKVAVYCKRHTLPVNTVHCVDKIHIHLVSRLRISGVLPLTPLKCLRDVVQGQLFCSAPVLLASCLSLKSLVFGLYQKQCSVMVPYSLNISTSLNISYLYSLFCETDACSSLYVLEFSDKQKPVRGPDPAQQQLPFT